MAGSFYTAAGARNTRPKKDAIVHFAMAQNMCKQTPNPLFVTRGRKRTDEMPHFEDVECLPDCDETHAEDCPRSKAEMEYYRAYFGVGTPAFYNFRPVGCDCDRDRHNTECRMHGKS